ncbi:MAG: hypothetical protein ABIJ21_07520 [Nanoarchaeota archaeon]
MSDQHFYVENARLMSQGLSNIGVLGDEIRIFGNERIEELAGKLVGYGIHQTTRDDSDRLLGYCKSPNPFIRKAAYMGLMFAGLLGKNDRATEYILHGFKDDDIDVKKAAIIAYGLANFRRGNGHTKRLLDSAINDDHWKIRSSAGLAYSFAFFSNPEHYEMMLSILIGESSPYVKVSSSWYISTAFAETRQGLTEYEKLLKWSGDGNSFFRDMGCLGLGISFLGSNDAAISSLLEERIMEDTHPYVRESAYFGLALNSIQSSSPRVNAILESGLHDESKVVRSGAALSLGLLHMGNRSMTTRAVNFADPSVQWGLGVSRGLDDSDSGLDGCLDDFVRWGFYLGNCFRQPIKDSAIEESSVALFQNPINLGLRGSNIAREHQTAFKLIYPGIHHLLVYDSFWWGLLVLSYAGAALYPKEGGM